MRDEREPIQLAQSYRGRNDWSGRAMMVPGAIVMIDRHDWLATHLTFIF